MHVAGDEFSVKSQEHPLRLFFVGEFDETISGRVAGQPIFDDAASDDGLLDEKESGGDESLVHFRL